MKRKNVVCSVSVCFVCVHSIVLEEDKGLFMIFGLSKIQKYRITFKFMLSDVAMLDMLHGLNCLSQEEFFMKLFFSIGTLRNFINH